MTKWEAFNQSATWMEAVSEGTLRALEDAIHSFLSGLDIGTDPKDFYYGYVQLFQVYVQFQQKSQALLTLDRLDKLEVEPDDDCSSIIAENLFSDFGDLDRAELYVGRALSHATENPDYLLTVNCLAMRIAVSRDPHSSRVRELLRVIHDGLISRRFSNRHLVHCIKILAPMGLVPWWGREILEAVWSARAVNAKFHGVPDRLEEIEEIYALLPPWPEPGEIIAEC